MFRLTAKFVLLILSISAVAPVATAVSSPLSHACCMRKAHSQSSHEAAFEAACCCSHDHSGLLTSSQVAVTPQLTGVVFGPAAARLGSRNLAAVPTIETHRPHSGGAPPSIS